MRFDKKEFKVIGLVPQAERYLLMNVTKS